MKLRPSEKSLWQNIVLAYAAEKGMPMHEAIRQADEFVEAYRERTRPTPKLLTGTEALVSKVCNILPGTPVAQATYITQQALTIARTLGSSELTGKTIRAIKQLREITGLPLRESQTIIDATFDFLQNIG